MSLQPKVQRVVPRLFSLALPHVRSLFIAGICLLLASSATLAYPYIISQLTNDVFVQQSSVALDRVALLLGGSVLATAIFSGLRSYLLSSVGNRIVTNLRIRLYEHLQRLSISYYDDNRIGEIISRLTNDTALIQETITSNLLSFIQQIVILAAVVVIVVLIDWHFALVAVVVSPLIVITAMLIGKKVKNLSQHAQTQAGTTGAILEETLSAIRIVKAFGRESYEVHRYKEAVNKWCSISIATLRVQSFFEVVVLATGFGSIGVMLWFGGHEVLVHRLSPGGLIAFLLYLMMLLGPLQTLSTLYGSFQRTAGAATRIFEILDIQPEIVDQLGAYDLPLINGRVEICNLSFAYSASTPEVLHNITLTIQAGQTVAVVGPSGAGKTSLASLLLRFYDPTSGHIFIDGHDLHAVTIASLRSSTAIVPQETTLFAGTIQENILYGRLDATQEEVEAAAYAANAHNFIMELSEGYNTMIGERGMKLSGGQRQRIAIARALLKNPRLLVLDEATSSLDSASEHEVKVALERLMVGRTTLVITHRLATIEGANHIIVLDHGEIVEQGTHVELLAHKGLYYTLHTRTSSEEAYKSPSDCQAHTEMIIKV